MFFNEAMCLPRKTEYICIAYLRICLKKYFSVLLISDAAYEWYNDRAIKGYHLFGYGVISWGNTIILYLLTPNVTADFGI